MPLVVLVIFSFDNSTIQTLPYSGFTTKWFHAAFSERRPDDVAPAKRRDRLFCAVGGDAPRADGGRRRCTARRLCLRPLWTTLMLLPLVVPYVVLAVGMLILLQRARAAPGALSAVLVGHVAISCRTRC